MKRVSYIVLVLLCSPVQSEGIIVPSVLNGSPNISQKGKEICVSAAESLDEELARLNGKLYWMESHPEDGYDIRHQDRMEITSLIDRKTEPMMYVIRKAAYDGNGQICLDNLQQGVKLAHTIYNANIKYRKINARQRN